MNTLLYIFRKNCLIFVSVGHHNYSFKTKNSIEKPMLMWICWESLVILFWIFIGCQSGETPIFPPWARDQSWIPQISTQKAWGGIQKDDKSLNRKLSTNVPGFLSWDFCYSRLISRPWRKYRGFFAVIANENPAKEYLAFSRNPHRHLVFSCVLKEKWCEWVQHSTNQLFTLEI